MKEANKYIALLLTIAMLLTIVPRTGFCGGTRRAGQQEETIFKEESTGRKSPVVTELTEERDRYTNGMGRCCEQHPQPGGGNNKERVDL